jgi:hypothetical protein
MMMIFLTILFGVCAIVAFITGILIDLKTDPSAPLILTFFLSIIIGLSAIITFIAGYFMGV